MHQAQVDVWGEVPKYVEAPDPQAPNPDELRLKMLASGLHHVVRRRASGKHYSSGSPPHVPGVDGVGTAEDGTTYYFFSFGVGAMADYVNVPKRNALPLPEGLDPIQAAGIVNPAMSSWLAFKSRVHNLPKDFTVLILGATSASGRVAIPLARSLGASKVIGAARNKAALDTLGLDGTVVIAEQADQTDFDHLPDIDVIIDYVYGPLTEHLLTVIKIPRRVQYVHIGAISGPTFVLPAVALRSKNLSIIGSGVGAWNYKEMAAAMPGLLMALKDVPQQPVRVAKLAGVEKEWLSEGSERLVFVP